MKIKDLIPLLNEGWVAMDYTGDWYWYSVKPKIVIEDESYCVSGMNQMYRLSDVFDIEPVKDWKKSLRKVC